MNKVIVGAGGAGRSTLGALRTMWHGSIFFADDAAKLLGESVMGVPVVGSVTDLVDGSFPRIKCGWVFDSGVIYAVVAFGTTALRKKVEVCEALEKRAMVQFMKIVHRAAWVEPDARVGHGSIFCSGVMVQVGAEIGRHVFVCSGTTIDHDCRIGDYAYFGPGAHLCGHVQVGEGTLIGAGAVILPGVQIGRWATVGAGAVVTKDVPDGVTVKGVPAR